MASGPQQAPAPPPSKRAHVDPGISPELEDLDAGGACGSVVCQAEVPLDTLAELLRTIRPPNSAEPVCVCVYYQTSPMVQVQAQIHSPSDRLKGLQHNRGGSCLK